jgi:HK97 gp10 family phage protein
MASGTNVQVDVMGETAVVEELGLKVDEMKNAVEKVIVKYTLRIEREIKSKLSTPGSGQTYQRGGVQHQASAPGEPPATDRGRLRASIHHVLTAIAQDIASGKIIAGDAEVEYASYLEFGTADIDPRPFMRPALEEHKGDFVREMKAALAF